MAFWDEMPGQPAGSGAPPPGGSAAKSFWDSLPGAEPPAEGGVQRGTLAAGLKTGMHSVLATGGELVSTALENPGMFLPGATGAKLAGAGVPLTAVTPKAELLELYKNDPTAFAEKWNSPLYAAHRFAEEQQRKASEAQLPENLTPEARERAKLEYATTDPAKSALLSPIRIAGDVLASAPSTLATLGAVALTRNPSTGMIAGGLLGAGTEGLAQVLQVREDLANSSLDKWQNVPEFKEMVGKKGWHPEMARAYLTEKYATEAGIKSGVTSGVLEALGGRLIGHFAEKGASLGKRALIGAGEGSFTEAGEGVEQQIGQNVAARATYDPARAFWEGVGESAAQGAVVGGVSSSMTNAAIGRRVRQDQQHSEYTAGGGDTQQAPPPTDTTDRAAIKAKITRAAEEAGVPPEVALVVAQIESGLNPNVRSAMMERVQSAGLYQFLPIAMKQYGVTRDELLASEDLQIATGVKMLRDNIAGLTRFLGRAPEAHEVYMGQLFGPGGVRAVLGAPSDARILDIVAGYDPANAANVVAWNGMQPTWTRDEVVAHYRKLVQAHMARLGGGLPVGTEERVASASRRMSDLDVADEEVDRILARTPEPTQEQRRAGEEAVRAQTATTDPETEAALQRMEGRQNEQEAIPPVVDRALAARREATYNADWVKDNFVRADGKINLSEAAKQLQADLVEALQRGDKVVVRQEGSPDATITKLTKAPLALLTSLSRPGTSIEVQPQTRADSGVSADELLTRQRTSNRNDRAAFRSLPVVGAGVPLEQHRMSPGEVAIAAHPTEAFPQAYQQAMRQTVQQLVSQFAPSARIVLTAQTPDNQAAGFYRRLPNGFYQINPRNLTRSEQHGQYRYNETSKLKAAYGATHEVGHLIIDHEFFADLPAEVEQAIDRISGVDTVPEAVIAQVERQSPEKAAILREYNTRKTELLAPGRTAEDFANAWLSPWKLAHGIGQGDVRTGWYRFIRNYFLGERARTADARTAALAMDAETGILGFHEYAAEQFARYAYSKRLLERTALGASNWFKSTFEKLRALFVQAKKDRLVRAGTEFQAWLNGLAETAQAVNGPALPVPTSLRGVRQRFDPDSGLVRADDPIVQETRATIDARFTLTPEVEALLANGQVEQARELAESGGSEAPTIVRWDRDSPLYTQLDDFMRGADKLPPVRGASRRWFSSAFRRLADFGLYFTDLRQAAAADPFNIGLGTINRLLTDYKERLGRLEQRPVDIAQRWSKLRKGQDKAMQELMQVEWRSGRHLMDLGLVQGQWRLTPNVAFTQAARAAGLDEQTAQLYVDVKNEYLYRLNRLHNVLRTNLQRKIDEALLDGRDRAATYYTGQMFDLKAKFDAVRQLPYLPQTRFGQYLLEVQQRDGSEWRTTHIEAFESPEQRAEARAKLQRARRDVRIAEREHDSTSAILRTLPLDVLDDIAGDFGLTPRQMSALRGSLDMLTSSPLTRKYSPELAVVTGYSRDGLRVFADFMHHDALVTNKLLFRPEFKDALARMREDIGFANAAGDSDRVARMEQQYRFANGFVQQILNPAHEWHTLRAAVVFTQLGFNIKSAVMNLTSLIQTWASITTRLGLKGNVEFAKGLGKVAGDSMVKSMQGIARAPKVGWEAAFTPDERWAMRKGYESGIIQESFAASLASMSHEGVLERMGLPRSKSWPGKVMALSTKPLRMVEEYTRRVTLLSMFNAARRQGMDRETAYQRAVEDTLLLQGDNSIANRAPVLRGPKSAFLLYYNYMRNMTWILAGGLERGRHQAERAGAPTAQGFLQGTRLRALGGETARMWLAYLMLGGLMGEPFAEDLDKLADLLAKQLFGERFSLKEHAYELAGYISQGAAEIGLNISPRSIVHGMASDFFGVDVSGSVSVGNAIPGLGGIDKLDDKQGQVKALTGLLGPLGERVQAALNLFNSGLPAERQFAFFLPTALQNLVRGMESDPKYYSGGKVLVDAKTGEVTSLSGGQMAAQMMGFTPAAVRANQEVHWMQQEYRTYWVERRNGLLRKALEAFQQGDADAKYDVQQRIAEYNSEAPSGMKLTHESIRRSMTNRLKAANRDERGAPQERGLTADFNRMRELVLGSGR